MEPARPTWSSTPQPPAEAFAASLPLLAFSRRPAHLMPETRQDLLLSRTVIVDGVGLQRAVPGTYVDRFACDWHRLAGLAVAVAVRAQPFLTQPRTRADSMTETLAPRPRRANHGVSCRPGDRPRPARRRVAATAATATGGRPTASRARWASRGGRAGGQHVVADQHVGPAPPAADPRERRGRDSASSRPCWRPGRPRRDRPGRRRRARPAAARRPRGRSRRSAGRGPAARAPQSAS